MLFLKLLHTYILSSLKSFSSFKAKLDSSLSNKRCGNNAINVIYHQQHLTAIIVFGDHHFLCQKWHVMTHSTADGVLITVPINYLKYVSVSLHKIFQHITNFVCSFDYHINVEIWW